MENRPVTSSAALKPVKDCTDRHDARFAQLYDLIEKDTVMAGNVLRLVNVEHHPRNVHHQVVARSERQPGGRQRASTTFGRNRDPGRFARTGAAGQLSGGCLCGGVPA